MQWSQPEMSEVTAVKLWHRRLWFVSVGASIVSRGD